MQLVGLNTQEIEAVLQAMGEPAFRGRQVAQWIYRHGATSFEQMANLGKELRARLAAQHSLDLPPIVESYHSRDGSTKLLVELADGERIETVRLPYPDRLSVCVSSQAGCAMACAFCATGLGGFRRNLTAAEIISQPLLSLRIGDSTQRVPRLRIDDGLTSVSQNSTAKDDPQQKNSQSPIRNPQSKALSHIVFMGMGEPLLNYQNVLKAIHLLHDEMGVPMRHITVSTVGILPGMRRLAEEKLQLTLAVSLHAPFDALRHRLIPTSRKTKVAEIVGAAKDYVAKTGRRVTFEYVLLGGVNDQLPHAKELAKLCRGWPSHVNLIPWNAVPDATFEGAIFNAPQPRDVQAFAATLERAGIAVTQRVQRGADVAAACGQLRAVHETAWQRS
jgi:23S rRNA (adenine2503-C2)-methyltransferase